MVQIYARNRPAGLELAERVGTSFTDRPGELAAADVYIVSVSDAVVSGLSGTLPFAPDAVVAHTAGGLGLDALGGGISHKAVLYPLQTFTKGREVDFKDVPLFVEYSDDVAKERIEFVANALSDKISHASAADRVRMHTAAVFASNFTNYMYCAAEDILRGGGIEFDILKPLIRETALKALELPSPAAGQTGPAVRGDYETQNRHLRLLEAASPAGQCEEGFNRYEYYEKIYKLLSESIWETLKKT